MHACYLWHVKGYTESPGTEVMTTYKAPCGCWELKLDLL